MKRLLALLLILIAASACAEGTYDEIDMSMTFDELSQKYTSMTREEEYWCVDDALLVFYESGKLNAKCLNFDTLAAAAPEANAEFEKVLSFKQGTSISELTDILGEGREIVFINISDEENSGKMKVECWKNGSGQVLEALFELDDNVWSLFALTVIDLEA